MKTIAILFTAAIAVWGATNELNFDTSLVLTNLAETRPTTINGVTMGQPWTNKVSRFMRTIEVQPVDEKCPECGGPNHHERRITWVSVHDEVYLPVIAKGGKTTNHISVATGPTNQVIVTNITVRTDRNQPGFQAPPTPLQ